MEDLENTFFDWAGKFYPNGRVIDMEKSISITVTDDKDDLLTDLEESFLMGKSILKK